MHTNKIEQFCTQHDLTIDQFYGTQKIEGVLYLSGLTSIPEGFNPTVGEHLYLRGLTSIPEGFNPTVGGDLYWKNNSKRIGAQIELPTPQRDFFWKKNGVTYAVIDRIFCEILSKKESSGLEIFKAKKIGKLKEFFIASDRKFFAHGDTVKIAVEDLKFKAIADKLKKEPIEKDTLISVMYYRTITGACDMGVRNWMQQNNIPFEVVGDRTVEIKPITAQELLPILEKSNAYVVEKIKKLVNW